MALIQINNLNFTYSGEKEKVLSGLNLTIEQGEFVVLCGSSGSGKTTLLKNLKREISPAGKMTGDVFYKGIPLNELQDEVSAKEIGMVFQDPDSQIVMDTVIQELAFSLENFGYKPAYIKKKISEMVTFFGLEECLHKSVQELSGGQKQTMNICSVMLLEPRVLLLDEPTSQLDPVAAHELIKMVHQINQEFSVTVIISEHRLEQLFPIADRVVFMEEGSIKYCNTPVELSMEVMKAKDSKAVPFIPPLTRLFFTLPTGRDERLVSDIPLSVRSGKQFMQRISQSFNECSENEENFENSHKNSADCGNAIITCKDVSFRYDREKSLILKKLSLKIYQGEFMAILGGNGAGKTTLLQAMAGLISPQQGCVYLRKKRIALIKQDEKNASIGYVAQNPLLHFTFDTVNEELKFASLYSRSNSSNTKMEEMLELFEMKDLLDRHPYDLSGGQQQKLVIACALIPEPEILMIDEPTKGLDSISKDNLARLLKSLKAKGITIVMVTHDIEFAACHAEKCAMLFDGSITDYSSPSEFFSGNYFYTTSINRAVRDYLPHAITCEDVMKACRF